MLYEVITVSQKLGIKGMDRASEDSITAREIALAMCSDSHIHRITSYNVCYTKLLR